MNIEKLLDTPLTIGRKAISYVATDPAGEICLFSGYKLIDDSLILSIPLLLFGAYHIPNMIKVRKKLNHRVQKNKGLSKEIIEPFNRNSWCSHRVAIAYVFEKGKYKEFKKFLHQY